AFSRLYSDDTETSEPFIVLNGTIDFKESSNTLAEMQLNENKTTNAKEFAKLFHVSPEAVSGGTADTSTIAKLAAIPLMNVIQSALNRDLLKESEKGRLYFAFDTRELLKGDITERYNAYKTALDANFMQPDEVRYLENLEPMGLNFIKLGLQDVLYNPDTKEVFTPNTGKTQNLENSALYDGSEDDIIESRAWDPMKHPKNKDGTWKYTGGRKSTINRQNKVCTNQQRQNCKRCKNESEKIYRAVGQGCNSAPRVDVWYTYFF
ncbi:MAG: phage portal protein, partial [Oscillospiraceae bacterium]|nr:phage portal protein [Oscillospiraceae bacterium]